MTAHDSRRDPMHDATSDPDLDALRQTWKTLAHELQRGNTLQLAALADERAGRVRARLRPLAIGQGLQLLFGIATVLAGVALWKTFAAIVPVLVCGIVLHAYGVATIIASAVVLNGIAGIDRSLPVLELQRRLAKLRRAYLISGMVVGLPWWLLWMLPIVVIAALQGAQTGTAGLPAWVWITLAGGLLGLAATWGVHRWLQRPGREALARRVEDAAAGGSLRRAQAELEALNRFMDDAA